MSLSICYENISRKSLAAKVQSEDQSLYVMQEVYQSIELPRRSVKGKRYHIYPSERIFRAYQATEGKIHKFLESINLCAAEVTLYLNEDKLEKKQVSILRNKFVRNNKVLKPGNYIYIIDQNNKLYVTKKKTKEIGSYHHSSLSGGLPVIAAGTLEILVDQNKKNRLYYRFSNLSGHYKPNQTSTLKIALWLKEHKLKAKKSIATDIEINHIQLLFLEIWPKKK